MAVKSEMMVLEKTGGISHHHHHQHLELVRKIMVHLQAYIHPVVTALEVV